MLSLLLDKNWDITVDSSGNLAVVDNNYSIAQAVANAVKLFTNDAYFDTQAGIPHFEISLKRNVSTTVVRTRIKEAAESVPGVKSATVNIVEINNNTLQAEIQLTLDDNTNAAITASIIGE